MPDRTQGDSSARSSGSEGPASAPHSLRAEISKAIVGIHARSYGRGPTKARTFVGEDHVMCILENIYTPVERTLIDAGKAKQVTDMRGTFQEVARAEFVAAVERITGRRVRAFLSQVHHDPDLAVEVFVFDRARSDSPD